LQWVVEVQKPSLGIHWLSGHCELVPVLISFIQLCLPVNSYLRGSVIQNVSAKIQERKFAVFIKSDGEFDVLIDAVYVFSELLHVVFMKNGECVIHTT